MIAIKVFVAAAFMSLAASAASAERCATVSTGENGEPKFTDVTVNLASRERLDRRALPENASALMCARSSIVPLPDDVRVLTEWGIPFGVSEGGARAIWISLDDGRLQTTVDNGELSRAERAALDDWLRPAQARVDSALARRPTTGPGR